MTYKHLIVHVDSGERAAERVDLAVALALRMGARLTGLFAEVASVGASIVGRRNPERLARAMAEARAAFEARTGAAGVASAWWALDPGEPGEVTGLAAVCCRYADLAVVGQHDGDELVPPDLVTEIVLGSGRPALVVPSSGHHVDTGKHVVVAWNGSREAARALNDAIPLMEGAESVLVLALLEPSSAPTRMPPLDVLAQLRAHGLAATYERVTPGDVPGADGAGVLDAVLNRVFDSGADLLVMGFGPHGRSLLGRTRSSQAVLRSMLTPVLLSA
ncbi:MAG TPA: universal stress protein [Anaeromyxobacteraceae bacterium]